MTGVETKLDRDLSIHSQNSRKLPAELPDFSAFIRQAALKRFAYISGVKDATLSENPRWDDFCYGSSLSVILIAGKDFKIFFKAHFHAKKFANAIAPGKERAAVFDFFREYCNLTAGAIKQSLQKVDIICGISLPSVTSGYDELIFSDTIRKERAIDCFDLRNSTYRFTVTTTLDTGNTDMLARLKTIKPEAQKEEEIEFL